MSQPTQRPAGHLLGLLHEDLVRLRDENDALFAEFGFTDDRGQAQAFRLALALLAAYTFGEYGQPLADRHGVPGTCTLCPAGKPHRDQSLSMRSSKARAWSPSTATDHSRSASLL